jgi:hypothetical protein
MGRGLLGEGSDTDHGGDHSAPSAHRRYDVGVAARALASSARVPPGSPSRGPYSGRFVDNIPQSNVTQRNCSGQLSAAWSNGVAEFSYGNGNIYRGEFVSGHREGIGMLDIRATGTSDDKNIRMPARSVYAGEFRGDRLNGQGMVFSPGAGFYGIFANNLWASAAGQ